MLKKAITCAVLVALWGCSESTSVSTAAEKDVKPTMTVTKSIAYPETKQGTVVDQYFDEQVADPYRWLEDDMSSDTADWVKTQNNLTF